MLLWRHALDLYNLQLGLLLFEGQHDLFWDRIESESKGGADLRVQQQAEKTIKKRSCRSSPSTVVFF